MPNLTPETRANLEKVLAFIEAKPHLFDMGEWIVGFDPDSDHPCGTAMCIGGTADVVLFGRDDTHWLNVGVALGLRTKEAKELFFCEYSECVAITHPRVEDAIRHLKAILAGAIPDWNACMGHTSVWRKAY